MVFISPNVLKTRFGRATIKLKVKEKGRICRVLTFEESILLGENRWKISGKEKNTNSSWLSFSKIFNRG